MKKVTLSLMSRYIQYCPLWIVMLAGFICLWACMSLGTLILAYSIINWRPNDMVNKKFVDEAKIIGIKVLSPTQVRFYSDRWMSKEEKVLVTESFLTALTVPEEDLWVNLKTEEPNRIAPYRLGLTKLGKIMLQQDLMLKKAFATAMYPKSKTGAKYLSFLYGKNDKLGAWKMSQWILPKDIKIVDSPTFMYIARADLGVEFEEMWSGMCGFEEAIRTIILPEVEELVDRGASFVPIRQAYRAVICAMWFKNKFNSSIYKSYINANKTAGIEIWDKNFAKHLIWKQFYNKFTNGFWHIIGSAPVGGIRWKKLANAIVVYMDNIDPSDRGFIRLLGDAFTVTLKPSDKPISPDQKDNHSRGKIGGISLNCKVLVQKGTLPATEEQQIEFKEINGLDYTIGK